CNVYSEAAKNPATLDQLFTNLAAKYPVKKARGVSRGGPKTRTRDWAGYFDAVTPGIKELAKLDKLPVAEAMKLLAPGMDLDVDWNSTWAAGDIREADIVRNFAGLTTGKPQGKTPRFTMKRALGPLGYEIVDAGSPTNPKEHGRGANKEQLADLYLVNEYWKTTRSGIVVAGSAELKPVDDSKL